MLISTVLQKANKKHVCNFFDQKQTYKLQQQTIKQVTITIQNIYFLI